MQKAMFCTLVGLLATAQVSATIAPDACAVLCTKRTFSFFALDDGECLCGDTAATTSDTLNILSCAKALSNVKPASLLPVPAKPVTLITHQTAQLDADDPAAFLAAFTTAARSVVSATTPADFPHLVSSPKSTGGGHCEQVASASATLQAVTDAGVPAGPLHDSLVAQIPLLFLGHKESTLQTVIFQGEAMSGTAPEDLLVGVAAVAPIVNSTDFLIAVVWQHATGAPIQQQQNVHECHGCWLVATCCSNHMQNVAMSSAQLDHVKIGMYAVVAAVWATPPVTTCAASDVVDNMDDTTHVELPMQEIFQLVQSSKFPWDMSSNSADVLDDNPLAKLKAREQAFVNSGANQDELHRKTSDTTVNTIREKVATMASATTVITLPGLHVADMSLALTSSLSKDTATTVAAAIQDGFVSKPDTTGWFQTVVANTTTEDHATAFTYASVFLYALTRSADGTPTTVDMVICSMTTAMNIADLVVTFDTHTYLNGTTTVTVHTSKMPAGMSRDDIKQFATVMEFIVADAFLASIKQGTEGVLPHTKQNMRIMLPRHELSDYMELFVLRSAICVGDGGAENFKALWSSAVGTLADKLLKGGGFIHSTSQTAKIVTPESFKNFTSSHKALKLPGVDVSKPDNIQQMCNIMLNDFSDKIRSDCIGKITLMLLTHGNDTDTTWLQMDHKYNSTIDKGLGDIFTVHLAPHKTEDNYHDFNWVVYDYSFALLGALEMIETKSSWIGGLFSSTNDKLVRLPPVWTAADATAMSVFLEATLDCITCMATRLATDPQCTIPPFPQPGR